MAQGLPKKHPLFQWNFTTSIGFLMHMNETCSWEWELSSSKPKLDGRALHLWESAHLKPVPVTFMDIKI